MSTHDSAPAKSSRADRSASRPRRLLRSLRVWLVGLLAVVGAVALLGLTIGALVDLRGFDRTSGGYEPPYQGWTGTPTDWAAQDVTDVGFRHPGYVLSTTFDCDTGMIAVEAFGLSVDFRVVSERGIAVHQPRQACVDAGFQPGF